MKISVYRYIRFATTQDVDAHHQYVESNLSCNRMLRREFLKSGDVVLDRSHLLRVEWLQFAVPIRIISR